jgi:hypothetical protein
VYELVDRNEWYFNFYLLCPGCRMSRTEVHEREVLSLLHDPPIIE